MAKIKVKSSKQGLTNNKKREDALGRIAQLEQMNVEVVKSVDNSFKQIAQDNAETANTIHNFDLLLQAMIEVLDGTEKKFSSQVKDVLTRLKIAELEAKAEKQLTEVAAMEKEGKISKVDTVTSDNDFVITSTKGEDGQQRYPSKSVGIVGMFVPGVKELLIGKKVGETLTLPTGGTLEIVDAYKLVEKTEETPVEG